MKTILLKMIVCCTALLPFSQAHAADPAGKKYGGFSPGDRFKLTMIQKPLVTVVSAIGGGTLKKVPAGFPDFTKGQRVSFKIGAKGQLLVENFSIPFNTGSSSSNVYGVKDLSVASNFSQAAITKSAGKPTFMNLVLRKKTGAGFSTKVTQVAYYLE